MPELFRKKTMLAAGFLLWFVLWAFPAAWLSVPGVSGNVIADGPTHPAMSDDCARLPGGLPIKLHRTLFPKLRRAARLRSFSGIFPHLSGGRGVNFSQTEISFVFPARQLFSRS